MFCHEPTLQVYKLLLLDNLLMVCYHLVIILGNLYLFLFLRSQTERNTALSGIDPVKYMIAVIGRR